MDSTLSCGNKEFYDSAYKEYTEKMAKISAFAQKLDTIQSKFNS